MKYIRTTVDKIIKIDEKGCIKEFNSKLYAFKDKAFSYRFENGQEVVKQADTIEELCDCYVYIKVGRHRVFQTYEIKEPGDDVSFYDEIYGAIWTDYGLIYVAKMNDKGELELL